MKKNKTELKNRYRVNRKKYSALQQIEAFFQLNDLAVSKELLNNIVIHAVKRNSRINEDSTMIFQFHHALRSLIRAGYLIMLKERKWMINIQLENVSPLFFGLLSESEFQNPLLVFQKAFSEYSIKEFDYFMSGMVYFSMSVYENLPEKNIINPYINLMKMLDATYMIMERKEKNGTVSEPGR